MRQIPPELHQKRVTAGRKGGQAVKAKYGPSFFSINGRLGGRPRSLTLAEIESQSSVPQRDDKEDRRKKLPLRVQLRRELRGLLSAEKNMSGESVACGVGGSPGRRE